MFQYKFNLESFFYFIISDKKYPHLESFFNNTVTDQMYSHLI